MELAQEASPSVACIRELLMRADQNPILRPEHIPGDCKAVLNPAAVEYEGDVLLLLRVIGGDDRSRLVVARSRDGIGDWRIEPEALLHGEAWYDALGCEDARITYLPDRGEYAIVYVGFSRFGASVCLATTRDFKTVVRLGMAIHPYNKDAVLFPERLDGKYRLLHRPTMAPLEDIWMSESEDLIHWGNPRCVLQESDRPGWQGGKIGSGPPPHLGPHGWLLFYHGVERTDGHWTYRIGAAILDRDEPSRVALHWPDWIFGPTEPYEFDERGQGIVFPSGAVERDGRLLIYYGAGDRTVGLATLDLAMMRDLVDEAFAEDVDRAKKASSDAFDTRPEERV